MVTDADIKHLLTGVTEAITKHACPESDQTWMLNDPDVMKWLHNDTTFLEPSNPIVGYRKNKIKQEEGTYKNGKPKYVITHVDDETKPIPQYNKGQMKEQLRLNEATWQMDTLKVKRPDIFQGKNHKQSSLFGIFGEELVKEYLILTDKLETDKPVKLNGHQLDLETNDTMIEVKTGSYYTGGTANEKIYGVPFKYAAVPRLYKKPLVIVCVGGATQEELVNTSTCPEKEEMKNYWAEKGITYIAFTKLLSNL